MRATPERPPAGADRASETLPNAQPTRASETLPDALPARAIRASGAPGFASHPGARRRGRP